MSHLPQHLCPTTYFFPSFWPPENLLLRVRFHLLLLSSVYLSFCFAFSPLFLFYLFAQDLCHMQEDRPVVIFSHEPTHAHTCGSHTQPKGVCVRERYEYVCVHYETSGWGGWAEFFTTPEMFHNFGLAYELYFNHSARFCRRFNICIVKALKKKGQKI